MGVIQGSINNLLVTAGAFASLSPVLKERAEIRGLEKQYEKLDQVQEKSGFSEDTVEEITKEQKDIAKRIAQINPTEKNVQRYVTDAESLNQMSPQVEERERAVIKAQEALKAEQERAKMGRDFRSNTPEFVEMFTEGGRWK